LRIKTQTGHQQRRRIRGLQAQLGRHGHAHRILHHRLADAPFGKLQRRIFFHHHRQQQRAPRRASSAYAACRSGSSRSGQYTPSAAGCAAFHHATTCSPMARSHAARVALSMARRAASSCFLKSALRAGDSASLRGILGCWS
jgi:hypothetical protein